MISAIINVALSICALLPSLSKTFSRWFRQHDIDSVAKVLVNLSKTVTGTSDSKTALEKLQNDPKLLLSLQETIVKTGSEIELALLIDKQNARNRDISYVSQGKRNIRADIMVFAAVLGLVLCLIFIAKFQKNIPGEIIGIISTVAGIFGACLKDAYSFEFGTRNISDFRFKRQNNLDTQNGITPNKHMCDII